MEKKILYGRILVVILFFLMFSNIYFYKHSVYNVIPAQSTINNVAPAQSTINNYNETYYNDSLNQKNNITPILK